MVLVTLQRQLQAPFHRAGAEQNIALYADLKQR